MCVMGDPNFSMFSSYLSVLGIKVYNLTGVGLESGQRYIYVCKMSEFLRSANTMACNKSPIVPNTTHYLKSDYVVGLQSHESTYQD